MLTFLDSTQLAKEKMLDRLTVWDASDTAGLRAAPERSPQKWSAGATRLTAAQPLPLSDKVLVRTHNSSYSSKLLRSENISYCTLTRPFSMKPSEKSFFLA